MAVVLALAGALFPGLLYDPVDLSAGPFFWDRLGPEATLHEKVEALERREIAATQRAGPAQ